MTKPPRLIAAVVTRRRLTDDDSLARLTYWRSRPIAERLAEVESLRRMMIETLGDPDQPIARVIHRRRLGAPPR
jgi:hypothetical protein